MRGREEDLRGFTLIELLLALGLLSVLMLALVRLADGAFAIWDGAEGTRELDVAGARVLDELAGDLRALEPGPAGDLVCAWEGHDLDGDGIGGLFLPRLGLVRARGAAAAARAARARGVEPRGSAERVAVLWWLEPDPASAAGGRLLRAEEPLGTADEAGAPVSLVALAADAAPPARAGVAGEVVAEGVLWLSLELAAPTTLLAEGWRVGDALEDAAKCWDAHGLGRPDAEASGRNAPHAGLREPSEATLLPRRARLVLELERASDRARAPRLAAPLEPGETTLVVSDGRRLPGPGAHLRLGEEWLELVSADGERASVRRARRGTREGAHAAGTPLYAGRRVEREVPLGGAREEWLR